MEITDIFSEVFKGVLGIRIPKSLIFTVTYQYLLIYQWYFTYWYVHWYWRKQPRCSTVHESIRIEYWIHTVLFKESIQDNTMQQCIFMTFPYFQIDFGHARTCTELKNTRNACILPVFSAPFSPRAAGRKKRKMWLIFVPKHNVLHITDAFIIMLRRWDIEWYIILFKRRNPQNMNNKIKFQ